VYDSVLKNKFWHVFCVYLLSMLPDVHALSNILMDAIKRTPHGSLIPDPILKFFIGQCTGHCLIQRWLNTGPLAQWLKNEYDFPPDDIIGLFKEIKQKARDRAGIEILMPGQSLPPEALKKSPIVRTVREQPLPKEQKRAPSDNNRGTEWQGDAEGKEWEPEPEE